MPRKTQPKEEVAVTEELSTYIMRLNNGDIRKVTVPASWKITFGPTIPFVASGKTPYDRTPNEKAYSVRFYDGNKDNLKAVFGDVRDFRLANIIVEERITEVQRKVVQEEVPGQGFKDLEVEARVSRWCDPLQETAPVDNKFLKLMEG